MEPGSEFNLTEAQSFISRIIEANPAILNRLGEADPSAPNGINQEFLDKLDRVDKEDLAAEEDCPICATAFLDNEYPLVVALPCPGRHRFDLDCVGPWLLKNNTCPMCRHDVSQRQKIEVVSDSEDEYDFMYA